MLRKRILSKNFEMNRFSFLGRLDGLGNRLEEIIRLEAICSRLDLECEYIWRNFHYQRSYDILIDAGRVRIVEDKQPAYPVKELADFNLTLTQAEYLQAAREITPCFELYFPGDVQPVGVHIRGTDRIGKADHPHFMKDENELRMFLSETADALNQEKPPYVYVCSDTVQSKRVLIRHLCPEIQVVEPLTDVVTPAEYVDLFALASCQKIWMVSRFSTFSIAAALMSNAPLVTFVEDQETRERYKARFEYRKPSGSLSVTGNLGKQKPPKPAFPLRLAHKVQRLIRRAA